MTKILFILRHAQSADKQSRQLDYDRILTPRGDADSLLLGKKLKQQAIFVDLIVGSAAARVLQTVLNLNHELQIPNQNILLKKELYECSRAQWMDEIHTLPDEINRVILAGHNPVISSLAGMFVGNSIGLEPCEFIGFTFDVNSWKEIAGQGTKSHHIIPS